MAHIHKLYIMTLERSHRLPYCLGALGAKETPMEIVEPVFGIDDYAYDKSRALCEDAVKDGFDVFQDILRDGYHNKHPIGYLAQRWNYLRLFRKVIDCGEVCMILQDDYTFHGNIGKKSFVIFPHVDDLVCHLIAFGDFRVCIFGMDADSREIVEERELVETHEIPIFSKLVPQLVSQNDTMIVLSPAGAEYLTKVVSVMPFRKNVQNCLGWLWTEGLPQPKGNYTTVADGARPIFSDEVSEKYLPSTIHTDTMNWQVARPVETTRDT